MKTSMPMLMRRSSSGQGALNNAELQQSEIKLSRKQSQGLLANKRLSMKEIELSLMNKDGRLNSSGILINDPYFKYASVIRYLDPTMQHIIMFLYTYSQALEGQLKNYESAIGKLEKKNQAHLQSNQVLSAQHYKEKMVLKILEDNRMLKERRLRLTRIEPTS